MANGAGIPKSMAIVPEALRVSQFVQDTKTIQNSVSKMVGSVNRSLGRLSATSAALSGTQSRIDQINQGINANLATMNKWASGFDATNNVMTRFGTTIDQIGQRISRLSFQMERVGRSMTLFLTLPILGLGTATVKAGLDFEKGMLKVQNLVGTSAEDIALYRQEILSLSTVLGQLPTDLAAGLFAAASGFGAAGDPAQVLDVLEASAKGVTIGMGEMEDVARVTTAAMNAFADEGLSANQTVSAFAVAIQEGNFEVDKLATSLGNVLGTAKALGVPLSDVLAFISASTRFGTLPARSVTALNTALTNLLKPSKQNREVLDAYGLSIDEVKEKLAGPGGLAGLLINMRATMSEAEFVGIFGQRTLRSVLAITEGVEQGTTSLEGFSETYADIQARIRVETTDTAAVIAQLANEGIITWTEASRRISQLQQESTLDQGFLRTAETLGFKFQQIRAGIQSAFIGIFDAINAPLKLVADRIIEVIIQMNEWIAVNQDAVTVLVALAAAIAALGPALIIFAKIGQAIGFFTSVLGNFVRIIGLAVGGVIQLSVQAGVLAINIGVRLTQAFLLVGKAIYAAVLRMGLWIAAQAAAAAGSLVSWLGTVVGLLTTVGVQALAVAAAIGAIAAVGLAATGALSALWETLSGVAATVAESFTSNVDRARGWGSNIMEQFRIGIVEGFTALVQTLNEIGRILAEWLSPGSPPKIAPNIDDWGTKTMQEWIDGWLKADFDVFNQIQDKIETFLQSLAASAGQQDQEGAIARILLGTREAIAEAINQIRTLGAVTQATMDRIFTAIGSTTAELQEYVAATLAAAATTQELARAQERVNEINERYAQILKPIQEQLEAIDRQRQEISDAQEIERLERLLARGNLPEQVARLARLRLEEISLQQQQADVEVERDRELSIAEQQLAIAEDNNDAAQQRLEIAEEALGLQLKGFDLMAQMKKAVDSIASAVAKIPAKLDDIIAGGALSDIELPTPEQFDFGGGEGGPLEQIEEITSGLGDLQTELEELGVTWGLVWDAAGARVQLWRDTVVETWQTAKTSFYDKYGEVLDTLSREGTRTWSNLSGVFSRFWTKVEPDLKAFGALLQELGDEAVQKAPDYIVAISDVVNNNLIPALESVLDVVADTVLSGDFWAEIFGPPPEDDPIIRHLRTLGPEFRLFTDDMKAAWQETLDFFGIAEPPRMVQEYEGSALQSSVNTFMAAAGDAIHTAWTNATEPREDYVPIREFEGSPLQKGITTFWDAASELLDTAWKNATSPPDESVPLFEIFKTEKITPIVKNVGLVNTATSGLGIGFLTLGTRTDLARLAIEAIHLKVIALKDEALEFLRQKIEELRLKIEEWNIMGQLWWDKLNELILQVLDLALRIQEELMIALTDLYVYIAESVNVILEDLLGWFTDIKEYLKDKFEKVLGDVEKALGTLYSAVDSLISPLRTVIGLLKELWEWWNRTAVARAFGGGGGGGGGDGGGDAGGGGEAGAGAISQAAQAGIAAATTATAAGFTAQGNALPQSIASTAARTIGQAVSQAPTFVGGGRRAQGTAAPTVVANVGSTVAAGGGTVIQFGNVTINNEMDMATFEARVRNAVSTSMKS